MQLFDLDIELWMPRQFMITFRLLLLVYDRLKCNVHLLTSGRDPHSIIKCKSGLLWEKFFQQAF